MKRDNELPETAQVCIYAGQVVVILNRAVKGYSTQVKFLNPLCGMNRKPFWVNTPDLKDFIHA